MVVGEFSQETDLVVIGGGPAGYSAAFRAAELGVQTLLVDDREALGGVCLHAGCIPSKTLLSAAELLHSLDRAKDMGISLPAPSIDSAKLRAWSSAAIKKLSAGLTSLAKKHNVEVIRGRARFDDSRNLSLTDSSVARIRFRRAVIAVGSAPLAHPSIPFDNTRILTPSQAVALDTVPKSLLVVGCNYIALELAAIYAALGSSLTLISPDSAWLPAADADLVKPLIRAMSKCCAAMHLNTSIATANTTNASLAVTFTSTSSETASPQSASFDQLIFALGCQPNTASLNLEKTSVTRDASGFITVDETMHTTDPRIYAVGDITGPPFLADAALAQGRICGEVLADWNSRFDARAIPMVVFTDPQIAWVGLTENQARAENREVRAASIPWGASGRAVGMGRTDGLTKIIFDPETSLVLGVGITGLHAGEMIGEAALAIEMGAVVEDLASTIHAHPSMHELLTDAARTASAPK